MHKISVIIPIYNVEQFLKQCLDSIINQTYQNLEIILVNDGSTDSSAQICDNYAMKDERIKVIHKENGGLSDARNAGLRKATGDFISFVDSDDLIALDFYHTVVQIAIDNDADIVECGFIKFEVEEEFENSTITPEMSIEVFETEFALELLIKDYLQPMVWNKLYRKKVLIDLEFPVGKIHEDVFWTYQVFGNAEKIIKTQEKLYFYRQQGNSISGRKYSLRRLDAVQALEERISYMKENFPRLENLATRVFCFAAMFHYQMINENQEIDSQKIYRKKIARSISKHNKFSVLKNWDLKTIFWYQFFLISPNTSLKCRKHINKVRKLE